MDAQFLFVPKIWLRYILMVKLARVQANLLFNVKHIQTLTAEKYLVNK